MTEFYIKDKYGKYAPISFKQIVTKDWEDKLIVVRLGSDEFPVEDPDEEQQTLEALDNAQALDTVEKVSFLITRHSVSFDVLGSLKEIGEKYVAVRITGNDDLSKLGDLQKMAKKQLRGKTKKVIVMPTPLTVNDYKEVMDIKKRCDNRRNRRGQ